MSETGVVQSLWTSPRRRRWGALGLACAVLLAGCNPGGGLGAVAAVADPYARPGQKALLADGRVINLRCSGRGSPTVILESGFGAASFAWGKVQPALAKTTRVCSYDRAGSGFSDPGPLPRDGAAIARDLDQALDAARIEGPFIVVGHSAGGLYARLFAARRPQDIQGLLLLDPTIEQRAATPGSRDGLDGMRRRAQRCLANAEAGQKPTPGAPEWAGCFPVRYNDQALVVAARPDTWKNQLSELDSLFGRTSEEVMRMGDLLNDVPVYVITASDSAAASTTVGYDKPKSVLELQHLRLALAFRHGSQRTVLSSHLVMNDRPEVVIEAAQAMISAARAGKPPENLPSSELATEPREPDAAFPETTPKP